VPDGVWRHDRGNGAAHIKSAISAPAKRFGARRPPLLGTRQAIMLVDLAPASAGSS
jgi:thiamine phosphate synthase YjbQ (UPF0047 family)